MARNNNRELNIGDWVRVKQPAYGGGWMGIITKVKYDYPQRYLIQFLGRGDGKNYTWVRENQIVLEDPPEEMIIRILTREISD